MKFTTKLILFFSTMILFNCSSDKKNILELNGEVIGTDTKSIMLIKPNQDTRFDSIIEIPVINGKFHYREELQNPEVVNLAFAESVKKGMYRPMPLFLENEKIDLTLFTEEEFDKNIVKGGNLNSKYKNYKKEADSLFNPKDWEEQLKWEQEHYIPQNPSLVSYFLFLEQLRYFKENLNSDLIKNNYKKLSESNPNHPYNELASNLIDAIENIKVGKKYTDFSAPDLNGNEIKLSKKINKKVALLDLWATWCGPCISKSRTMVPLYNEYKDKGFTIIGVAGEFKNTDRLVKFLEKEKWEWINLVELDRQNNIWQKYGVDGGGGGIFLIDENGLILAKDPTAEEVRIELESRLN
ncbi:redoxin domain-containing protein [Thalassobellus citreus]|uniref:redoxin domain-containing protein n=1 Tax=Thalassobellus citreus TaxID=3367752 RepID=UPI0037A7A9AC